MLIKSPRILSFLGINAGENSGLSPLALISARKGKVQIGRDTILNCRFSFDKPGARIHIGERCYIGKSHLVSSNAIEIADDVVISWGVTIVDHDSHSLNWDIRKDDILNWHAGKKDWQDIAQSPVKIERRVWIGFNASILKGVTLGEGCVVGAGAVVTKSVAPYNVVAGNPARVVKVLDGIRLKDSP